MSKTILFFTTANLSTNPRCLKEVDLAIQQGYQPVVVAFDLGNWSAEIEKNICKDLPGVRIHYIDATRKNFVHWFIASLLQQISRRFLKNSKSLRLQSFAIEKRSFLLQEFLRKKTLKVDMVVAHNLGAFYPAYSFAKKENIPFGIDVEDYHPGESANLFQKRLVQKHMHAVLSKACYISYAAPLIQKQTEELLLPNSKAAAFCINNVFKEAEFLYPVEQYSAKKLQMVWFSQNIDYGRGLEHFLSVADSYENDIELTLIGNSREQFIKEEVSKRSYIKIHSPVMQVQLHAFLSNFDIGLAIEDIQADENRNICLTNKIWSYFQAGLYILASSTKAQTRFVQEYPEHAVLCDLEKHSIQQVLELILQQSNKIRQAKEHRFLAAKQYSWEKESIHLSNQWYHLLS